MANVPMLRDQLAELRIIVSHNDPAHVEAKRHSPPTATEIVHRTDIGPRNGFARAMQPPPQEQVAEPLAKRLMLGTVEAYDALAE